MTGQNIVCFAKDWNEDPTSNNHVMIELARNNKVLWLNSIATRTPKLGSGRDLRKIIAKLGAFLRGPCEVRPDLWTYTPIVIPLPHNRIATALNRLILKLTLRLVRWRLGMRRFQLWTFLPNSVEYVGTLGESLVVYYIVDEWSKFEYVDGPRVAEADRTLCRKADVVFAVSQTLVDDRLALNPETHLARHGVDHGLFSAALTANLATPSDLRTLRRPVLGFYGTLQNWVDFGLITFLADRHPQWSFVLIGRPATDMSKVQGKPNVHLLGRKPHSELPAYCKEFDVGLIPYVLYERILHVNPIKFREYLSAGVPVVAVALPELRPYARAQHCVVAESYAEFEQGIVDILRTDSPNLRRERSESMQSETWEARVADVCEKVMRVQRTKHALSPAAHAI